MAIQVAALGWAGSTFDAEGPRSETTTAENFERLNRLRPKALSTKTNRTDSTHELPRREITHSPDEPESAIARNIFCLLFIERSAAADDLFTQIVTRGDPRTVLAVALDEFAKKGNQDRLELCSRILAEMGRAAIETIQQIAGAQIEEQSAFVDLIASVDCLSSDQRSDLLRRLAHSKVEDTRWKLLDVLGCLSEECQRDLLSILEQDRVTGIAERARAEQVELGLAS